MTPLTPNERRDLSWLVIWLAVVLVAGLVANAVWRGR